ncbi:MAG: carbohydrate kinase family protein [Prolixibacteraceae bacterium]|nr:carbohydrate kinase family protein [Prolixibacteraceae bacterium]
MSDKIKISFTGCCLVDRLYNNVSFSDPLFSPYLSKKRGDGGLTPGQLVFKEEFEQYCGEKLPAALDKITKGKDPDKVNLGGPGIVPLIHAVQMLDENAAECRFYGCGGNDTDGTYIMSVLKQMKVPVKNYHLSGTTTPSTTVLSDPDFDNGHGERIFINSIEAAWDYGPENLDSDFFSSVVVIFGGTALVPAIHDNLTELLAKAKANGCISIVNTVYDFRNEKSNPQKRWPLGRSDDSYHYTDLLITDFEEALRLSGKGSIEEAIKFFRDMETGAVIITNGPNNVRGFSSPKSIFGENRDINLPVSADISGELKKGFPGDTTGCGDNFAGGIIASIVSQLKKGNNNPDLIEACSWGIVSGGFSCFYIGGTYFEKYPGEKLELITPYLENYKRQTGR